MPINIERGSSDTRETKPEVFEKRATGETKELSSTEYASEIARRIDSARETIKNIGPAARELANKEIHKLGLSAKEVAELPETEDFENSLRLLEHESMDELIDVEQKIQKEVPANVWNEALKQLDPSEVSEKDRERVIASAIGRLTSGKESNVYFHLSSRDRLYPGETIELTRRLSTKHTEPNWAYFGRSSEGQMTETPIGIRIVSADPELASAGFDTERNLTAGEELVRVPSVQEKRIGPRGKEFYVYTYVRAKELQDKEKKFFVGAYRLKEWQQFPEIRKLEESKIQARREQLGQSSQEIQQALRHARGKQ
jgi:hypothetical protein